MTARDPGEIGRASFDEVDVEIGGRLFVLAADVAWYASTDVDGDGVPSATSEVLTITAIEEAPREGDVWGLSAPVPADEWPALLSVHREAFERAVLDRVEAEAERAEERRQERYP